MSFSRSLTIEILHADTSTSHLLPLQPQAACTDTASTSEGAHDATRAVTLSTGVQPPCAQELQRKKLAKRAASLEQKISEYEAAMSATQEGAVLPDKGAKLHTALRSATEELAATDIALKELNATADVPTHAPATSTTSDTTGCVVPKGDSLNAAHAIDSLSEEVTQHTSETVPSVADDSATLFTGRPSFMPDTPASDRPTTIVLLGNPQQCRTSKPSPVSNDASAVANALADMLATQATMQEKSPRSGTAAPAIQLVAPYK